MGRRGNRDPMIDRDLKCSCNRFAYADAFSGEYGPEGYTCLSCLKSLNAQAVASWHASNQEHTNLVPAENTRRGFESLNRYAKINPLLKLDGPSRD